MKKLIDETGAKINVPPPSVMKDEIIVSGEVEGVKTAKATIMKIYEEKVCWFQWSSSMIDSLYVRKENAKLEQVYFANNKIIS